MIQSIKANWPAPTWVHALTTCRYLAMPENIKKEFDLSYSSSPQLSLNRLRLTQQFLLNTEPYWLKQTHSTIIVEANSGQSPLADGAWTQTPGLACVVLTGDCLPVLLTDTAGSLVAAVHAGWRGLANGILEHAVEIIAPKAKGPLLAWLGPAIGANVYEIGLEVREAFLSLHPELAIAFKPSENAGKWLANLYKIADCLLKKAGVYQIYEGEYCTFTQQDKFYSYRRDKTAARMASLIWMK